MTVTKRDLEGELRLDASPVWDGMAAASTAWARFPSSTICLAFELLAQRARGCHIAPD